MEFDQNVVLNTDRLILRYLKESDSHDIFININHDKDVLTYFIDKYVEDEKDMTLAKTINYCLENKRYLFAIELKDSHEVIGMILQCSDANKLFNTTEIGYAIGKKYWNQGYTTEAFKAMIDFIFAQGIHKIVASHIVENIASGKVMQKCGMIYEGRRKDELFYHDKYHDVECYYLINDDK